MVGFKTKKDGNYCLNCNAKVEETNNFCPHCGNPLTLQAIELHEQRKVQTKIETINEFTKTTTNSSAIYEAISYLNKLKQK